MSTTIIKYGLMKDRKLLGFYTNSNSQGDCCVSDEHILSDSEENEWLVDSAVHAAWVRNHPTEWYNADYGTPNHDFKPEDLKVVKITKIVEIEDVEIHIPSDLELFKEKYKNDPNHIKQAIEHVEKYKSKLTMNLYDTIEIMNRK